MENRSLISRKTGVKIVVYITQCNLPLVAVSAFLTKDLNSNCSFAAILLFKRERKNECSITQNIKGGHRKCTLLIASFQLTSLRLWHAGGQEQRGNVWSVARKRKSWARFNFYGYARPFIHCVYFIYARQFYAGTNVKITRQWKFTIKVD